MPKGKRRSAGGDRTDGSARPRSLSRGHGGPARAPRPAPRAPPAPLSPRRSALRPSPPAAPAARPPRGFRPPGRGRPHAAPRRPPSRPTPPSWPGPGPPPRGLRAEHGRRCPSAPARLCVGLRPAGRGPCAPSAAPHGSARLGAARRRDAGRWRRGAGRSAGRGGGGQGKAKHGKARRDEPCSRQVPALRAPPPPGGGGEGTAGRKGCAHPRGGGGREAAPRSKQQQTAARTGCLRAADALPSLLLPPAPPGRSVNVKAAVAGPLWGAALCRVRSVAVGAAGRAAVGALRSQRGPSAGTASRGADGASETERLGYTTETAASDRRYCSEGLPQRLISDRGTKGGGQRGSAPL